LVERGTDVKEAPTHTALTFSRELVSEVWGEAQSLIQDNHAETGALPKDQFSPSLAEYIKHEIAGALIVLTARKLGKLVGYSTFFLATHHDYPSISMAQQGALYVAPEHRGLGAVRFVIWCDNHLKSEGISHVLRQSTKLHDWSHTLTGLGYGEVHTTYVRAL